MMKHFLQTFFILSVVLCTPLWGQTYYVSSTQGSNDNDGLNEQTPKRDLTSIPKDGVTIRLKCGDVFWGGIKGYKNCIIGSYGEGERPVICGFKVLENPNAWKPEGTDLWSLDLTNKKAFVGNVGEDDDMAFNNIGFIYDVEKDKVYGRLLKECKLLQRDFEFTTSDFFPETEIQQHLFTTLIVKSKKNPSEKGHLCFAPYETGVSNMTNCDISGIAIVGFGKMGMSRLNGCNIKDCQIDLVGGSVQVGSSRWTRFGNGIELWYDCCDNMISNCLISRTYDCATTIQGNGIIRSNPRNNHFVNNRIYKCRQAFEHFLNPDDGHLAMYENCEFSGNVCYMMGDNEFDSPEVRDCNILSYENVAKSIIITDNVFFGSNHLDGTGIGEGMSGNMVYIYQDQYLYTRHWLSDKKTILSNEKDALAHYRAVAKDDSEVVIIKRYSANALWINSRIKRAVDWKPVKLHFDKY